MQKGSSRAIRLIAYYLFIGLSTLLLLVAARLARAAEVGQCEPVKEGADPPHLYFPIQQGRLLLAEIRELRIQKERVGLLEQKLKLQDEIKGWLELQRKAAETVAQKQAIALQQALKRIGDLEGQIQKQAVALAKAQSERVWWLVGGIAVGLVVVGVTVGITWEITKQGK